MELNKAMDELAPELPTEGIAQAVRRRHARRRNAIGAGAGTFALALVIGGALVLPNQQSSGPAAVPVASKATVNQTGYLAPADESTDTAGKPAKPADGVVAGKVMILKGAGDARAKMCLTVALSYPPQCSGPEIIGEIDWEKLKAEEASGARWAQDVWVVGKFDTEKRQFTLTQPPTLEKPSGAQETKISADEGAEDTWPDPIDITDEQAKKAIAELEQLADPQGPVLSVQGVSANSLRVLVWAKDDKTEKKIHDLAGKHLSVENIVIEALFNPLK